jgi:SPP1 family predicted phage head-tail adaptor
VRVRIGKLRHRVTLQSPSRTDDGGGGATIAWGDAADLWAALETNTGGETSSAGRLSGTIQAVVTIRYRDGVTPSMRFVLGARTLQICAVLDPDGSERFLRCLCEEQDL